MTMARGMQAPSMMLPISILATLWCALYPSSAALPSNDAVWERILDNANRRTANARTLQYGEVSGQGHPFESYSSQRLSEMAPLRHLQRQNKDNADVYFQDNRVPLPTSQPTTGAPSPHPTYAPTIISYNPSLYKPIRIEMDSRQLQPLIESDPETYADLVDYLITKAAPNAAKFWSDHLSTIPVEGSIIITEDDCPVVWSDDDDSEYHTFYNTDIVLYLLMDVGPCLDDDPPIAFSNDCAMDQFDRPTAGTLLICADNFKSLSSDSEEGRSQQQKLDEVLQHELAHVLGMSGATMPYWRDASNGGKPYTPRPLVESEVVCINGETQSVIMPSENTVMEGETEKGVRYFEVVTPIVRNVVANQFDCEEVTGARLDNNEYYNCIGSHLSPRMFAEETMVSRNMPWEQSISAVTMALFEDTGWYKANYTDLSPSSHGYGAGCDFLTKDCIIDGEIPDFGANAFCNEKTEESAIRCDVSHKRAALCDLVDYELYEDDPLYPYSNAPDPPSAEYQHFTNSGLGSFLRFDADYCPTYSAPSDFTYDRDGVPNGPRYMECSVSDTAPDNAYNFESFGSDDSTCFNTVGEINRPLCLSIECIESGGDITVSVAVDNGGEEAIICEEDGQLIDLPGLDVKIECPRREILCPGMFCPANCAGRGICRHGVINGCECFDPEDTSPLCENSPTQPSSQTHVPTIGESQTPSVSASAKPSLDDVLDDIPNTSSPTETSLTGFPTIVPTTSSTTTVTAGPSESPQITLQPTTAQPSTAEDEMEMAVEPEPMKTPSAAYATKSSWLFLLIPFILIQ